MHNPVIQWEICAKDPERIVEFYTKLFKWTFNFSAEMKYWHRTKDDDRDIEGGIFLAQGEMPNYVTLYIQVDDIDAFIEKAVSMGGTKIVGKTEIPDNGSYGMFIDPEGNPIGLLKR